MPASCENCNTLLTSRRNRAWGLCDECLGAKYEQTIDEEGYQPESVAATL